MRSRQATSTLTCPARMSFTVINRLCHGAPSQPPGRRVPPCLPTPGDVTPPAQPPNSTVRGGASLALAPSRPHPSPAAIDLGPTYEDAARGWVHVEPDDAVAPYAAELANV